MSRSDTTFADILAEARGSLAAYAPAVHRLPDGTPPFPAAHHLVWAWVLENDALGHTCIVAPPGHAKTNWAGIYYPSWYIGNHPEQHFVYVTNAASQAAQRSLAVRDTVEHNTRFQAVFPGVRPNKTRGWSQDRWYVTRTNHDDKDATFKAVGVDGDLLGARADRLLLDDVNDEQNVNSELQRERINDWVGTTAMSRLTPGARAINIQTRWHESDLAAWFEARGAAMVHMPALSDTENVYATIRKNGKVIHRVFVHDNGPALWPEFWPIDALKEKELILGPHRFAGMYQGIAVPTGGAIFKADWWKYWNALPSFSMVIQTWDTAYQAKTTSDFSVGQTWALGIDGRMYLLDQVRERLSFPELRAEAVRQFTKWKPNHVYVEERASGQSLIQELRLNTNLPVIPFNDGNKDKVLRAHGVTGYFAAGHVYIPRDDRAAWVQGWRSEMEFFPAGTHDDQVDATVMGVSILARYATPPMDEDYYEPQDTLIGNVMARAF